LLSERSLYITSQRTPERRPRASFIGRVGWLVHGASQVITHNIVPELTAGLRYVRSTRQRVFSWPPSQTALGPRVAVIVHYDDRGALSASMRCYLSELVVNKFSVVFVSNAGLLSQDVLQWLQSLCSAIIIRRNVGYDFGAWREALEYLGLPNPGTEILALANDSVYGPIRPLSETLERIRLDEAPVWGLTESWDIDYHLQSYFLVFGRVALTSRAWRQFWVRVRPAPSKYWLIRHYEVGLTQAMLRAGLVCKAVWPYEIGESAADKHRRLFNPTAHFWRELLTAGFPFIKRELLHHNPARVDITGWQTTASANATIDLSEIIGEARATYEHARDARLEFRLGGW
jgi:lipopolysaccharide biosynthesis protein